jgi:uncharacterized protein (DUF1786 family)
VQILTVDIGTGTQDIYLYRSDLSIENGFKLVMPSPTMIVRQNIQQATLRGDTILLLGTTIMSRMRAVMQSAGSLPCPLILMDTAPAAVLGATMDTVIRDRDRVIIVNIGIFHTLAFRLGPAGVEGLFEHHTGLLDVHRLEKYIFALADGTLKREEIYNDQGHGALILNTAPYSLDAQDWKVAITGPRREMMNTSDLPLYYAVPFGDMMLTGCFGLMAAIAEYVPELKEVVLNNMNSNDGIAPWDLA